METKKHCPGCGKVIDIADSGGTVKHYWCSTGCMCKHLKRVQRAINAMPKAEFFQLLEEMLEAENEKSF